MHRILIAECMQEISSFNPLPSDYGYFTIQRGDGSAGPARPQQHDRRRARRVRSARGYRRGADLRRPLAQRRPALRRRLATAFRRAARRRRGPHRARSDAVYVSLHGAMGAEGELDPEGFLLGAHPRVGRPDHADRDLARPARHPHRPHAAPDRRAGDLPHLSACRFRRHRRDAPPRFLLDIIDRDLRPTIVRLVIPALVRGDELITRTGCYGDLIREAQRLEREGRALAAGIMIGNPFTDVPELCSQVLIATDGDAGRRRVAKPSASPRVLGAAPPHAGQAYRRSIAPSPRRDACTGPVVFTDAADAHLVRRHRRFQHHPARPARGRLPKPRARAHRRSRGRGGRAPGRRRRDA